MTIIEGNNDDFTRMPLYMAAQNKNVFSNNSAIFIFKD